ncbi:MULTISPECIES: response regulator [unclassified Sphingopyxis]|jgi:CheY-like chemotaxis protein|uniref:response regulator n=1 Tax=unclassified Sphingopyxis TaxID=2614943 RepID=UPI0006BF98BC|nr:MULTISPECIES: response regulator [unclassified Sphingopyxis]USI75868.1 response regulator [Sphingopyxis sp. USTB-05]GAO77593.1 two-component response regulator [Sphingopyxis sp. C-1]
MSIQILYVDDEADIREVAEMALSLDADFDIRTCGSGREGIKAARDWQPDLILLDVMMPELDGPGVLEILRQDAATTAIPVVFITARTQAHEVARLRELGARGVIAKPFDAMTLARQVRTFLDG